MKWVLLLALVGCAHAVRPVDTFSRAQVTPVVVVVVPSCAVTNAFEGCKLYCMAKYQQDVSAAEKDKTLIHCKCAPFVNQGADPQEGI